LRPPPEPRKPQGKQRMGRSRLKRAKELRHHPPPLTLPPLTLPRSPFPFLLSPFSLLLSPFSFLPQFPIALRFVPASARCASSLKLTLSSCRLLVRAHSHTCTFSVVSPKPAMNTWGGGSARHSVFLSASSRRSARTREKSSGWA